MDPVRANDIIDATLLRANKAVRDILESDVATIRSEIRFGLDDCVREEIESLKEGADVIQNKLTVILETTGGYIEVVERMVNVFRRHYTHVNFVIPNWAYSAGTVLALSGDEIYMDYYSILGPIDPQFETESGDRVPGMGYISKYKDLVTKINSVSDDDVGSVRAEIAFLLNRFDPAKLFHIEQATEHSKALLIEWLPRYKFRNWQNTETRGLPVTEDYKRNRAEQIANKLADAEHWHSHGRGISRNDLEGAAIGLKTIDFGADPNLNTNIRHYHGLFRDYMEKLGLSGAIHTERGLRSVM